MEKINQAHIQQLRTDLQVIARDANPHFRSLEHTLNDRGEQKWKPCWNFATAEESTTARSLQKRMSEFGVRLMAVVRLSPLFESTDFEFIRQKLRQMSSALILQSYKYSQPEEIVGDDNRIYGVRPAETKEYPIDPQTALNYFNQAAVAINEKIVLLAPSAEDFAEAIVSSQTPALLKSRPNTAFIMMQINEAIPKLEDVKNTIKVGFKEFGINATRADEIEHSGLITQKILDEIATSEFLLADLTGERPSVYYEVGYAHALGKRPILYREKGAPLHFDLLVHNVPEYKNVTELSKILRERLKALTGREPKI
jgi:hypothetical protein